MGSDKKISYLGCEPIGFKVDPKNFVFVNKGNRKVSFDFDGTLSLISVQSYAKELIERGIEVWVCTSRRNGKNYDNEDLFKVTDKLKISRDKIIFTNYEDKSGFLTEDFIFHLDDCWNTNIIINSKTSILGINVFGNRNWKGDCEDALRNIDIK